MIPGPMDIPDEYWDKRHVATETGRLFLRLFFGREKDLSLRPREGACASDAWQELGRIMNDFTLKPDHKYAAWCYLFDQSFVGLAKVRRKT